MEDLCSLAQDFGASRRVFKLECQNFVMTNLQLESYGIICDIVKKLQKSKQRSDLKAIRQKINSNRELKSIYGILKLSDNETARILETLCEENRLENIGTPGNTKYIIKEEMKCDSSSTVRTFNFISKTFRDHNTQTEQTDQKAENLCMNQKSVEKLIELYVDLSKEVKGLRQENFELKQQVFKNSNLLLQQQKKKLKI